MRKRSTTLGPFLRLDIVMVFAVLGALLMLYRGVTGDQPAIEAPEGGLPLVAGIALAIVVLSWLASLLTGWDREYHDEYALRGLAAAANMAIYVTIIVYLVLDIFARGVAWLPGASVDIVMGVLMGSWSSGYFIKRLQGTGA